MAISSLSSLSVLRASREVTGTNSLATKAKLITANENKDSIATFKAASSALQNAYTSKGVYKITPIKVAPVTTKPITIVDNMDIGGSNPPQHGGPVTAPVKAIDDSPRPIGGKQIGGPIHAIHLDDDIEPISLGPIAYGQPGAPSPVVPEADPTIKTDVTVKADPNAKAPIALTEKRFIDTIVFLPKDKEYGTDPVTPSPEETTPLVDATGKFKPIAQYPTAPGIAIDTGLPPKQSPIYETSLQATAPASVFQARGPKQPIKAPPGTQPIDPTTTTKLDTTASKLDLVAELRRPKQPIKVPPIPQPVQADVDPADQPISLYPVNELA